MTAPTIAQRGPFAIEVEAGRTYFWCACGNSKRQPFCDGSHKGGAFSPVKWTADVAGRKFFCGCKHSRGQPFCDGTHKGL
jgi:CDGSH-type Zn-finger protein